LSTVLQGTPDLAGLADKATRVGTEAEPVVTVESNCALVDGVHEDQPSGGRV
jgi:hypothetical protein